MASWEASSTTLPNPSSNVHLRETDGNSAMTLGTLRRYSAKLYFKVGGAFDADNRT